MRKLGAAHWVAIVALMALAACGDGAGGLDRLARGERESVAQVRSGDVLVLKSGLVVRLAGIETPWAGEPGADQALAALKARVEGRQVQLLYGGARRDAYGRALAQVRLADGDGWVQGGLLRDGWARVRTWSDNRAMANEMLADEARARTAHRGLWAGPYRVLLPEEVDRTRPGFQIVEGWVRRVTTTSGGVYLDFTPDRSGIAVEIPSAAVSGMAAAGMAPASLQSQLVRVRGPIDWRQVMRIDHPQQIERLKMR